MKVLILNGSPKCARSNTIRIAKAFTEGFPEGTDIEQIDIYAKDIKAAFHAGKAKQAAVSSGMTWMR